jgi:hypothetical protein
MDLKKVIFASKSRELAAFKVASKFLQLYLPEVWQFVTNSITPILGPIGTILVKA